MTRLPDPSARFAGAPAFTLPTFMADMPDASMAAPPPHSESLHRPPQKTATPMSLGMVGLGKMGLNMTTRLVLGGHRVVAYDINAASVEAAAAEGAEGASSYEDLVARLGSPCAVWVMVPAGGPTNAVVGALTALMKPGDTIIDGGNSRYTDSVTRGKSLKDAGLHFVDAGTSGGIWGLKEGYCMMIGGPEDAVERLRPIFEVLAPAPDRGWGRVGPTGAGHFAKMVHNGIEYGMMQAFAEGFHILEAKTPFAYDVANVAEIWRTGSVIRSWLLDLAATALDHNPTLDGIAPIVADSGEGRWTVAEAIDLNVPAPVITAALLERIRSRVDNSYTDRMLAALRSEFGGHSYVKLDPAALPPNPLEGGDRKPKHDPS